MKNKFIIITFLLSICSYSQKASINKADKDYNNYAYIDAIAIYEKVAESGKSSPEILKKLGNSYYFNADLETAGKWYEQLFDLDSNTEPVYFYRYSQCLKSTGDYEQANQYLEKFAAASSKDSRSKRFKENKNYLENIKNNSNRYSIEDSGINTEYSDYGGTFYKDQFVFTTARDTGSLAKYRHSWTNESFSDLYIGEILEDGSVKNEEKFSKVINSKLHESTAVFTNDGNTIYFTRNNFYKGKKGENSVGVTMLKLYKAENKNGNWTNVEELPFNSDEYNVAHPSLSSDNKILYFASDMPGTLGMSDIFKVSINEDGSFGMPENLGNLINTEGRETFPYISSDNELFFASDGHLGLGGLDIFAVKIKDSGTLTDVFNVGTPVNSNTDDFGYIIDNTTKKGFFTSNREGGKGNDDIYKFTEKSVLPYNYKQSITGLVTDQETGEVLSQVKVTLLNENMEIIAEMDTTGKGEFTFSDLESDKQYYVRVVQNEYETNEKSIVTDKKSGNTFSTISMDKKLTKIQKGSDLAKALNIPIIYFDLDKSNIRKDAAVELAKVAEAMKQNPTIKIDVRSHTDSRQTANYNTNLSDRRAKSTVKWLVKNGIDTSRLTGSGYGESQLVNECADGVKCSEEQHQKNRRSEFIITAM